MANLIIKPASGSDSLILQDGAGAAVVTVSTNNVLYSKGVQETAPAANVASGTTIAVDLQTGNFFTADLQNASGTVVTWTVSNPAAAGKASAWTIKFIQGSTARALTYTSAFHWSGGVDHVMSTTNDAVDICSFFTIDGGTTIYASVVGSAFAA